MYAHSAFMSGNSMRFPSGNLAHVLLSLRLFVPGPFVLLGEFVGTRRAQWDFGPLVIVVGLLGALVEEGACTWDFSIPALKLCVLGPS